MTERTQQQVIRDFCVDNCIPKVYLRAHEEIVGMKTEAGIATIVTRQYVTEDRASDTRVTACTLVARVFRWVGDQYYLSTSEGMRVREESFEPIVIGRWSPRPVSEYIAKRDWARMCNAPGNDKRPQYSYRRLLDEPELTTSMSPKFYG